RPLSSTLFPYTTLFRSDPHRLTVGHRTIFHNAELQCHAATVTQHRRFRHDRIPIAPDGSNYTVHVVTEVHTFGGRQDFIAISECAAGTLRPIGAAMQSASGFWHGPGVKAGASAGVGVVLGSLSDGVLERAIQRTFRQNQTVLRLRSIGRNTV